MKTILQAENLYKTYRVGSVDVHALRDVSLAVEEGEFVAIMGPSGCGKSTLLHLLGGLLQPTSGRIIVDDEDVTAASDSARTDIRRRKIGFVFQRFNLFPTLTAEGNLRLAERIQSKNNADDAKRRTEVLKLLRLEDKMKHKPMELSGGEQQRVALARAIVNDPPILLADEPTGNLDPKTGWEIAEVINRINQDRGTTIVMCTHDRFLVNSLKRRVVRLVDGKIVSDEESGIYHAEDGDLRDEKEEESTGPWSSTPVQSSTPAPADIPPQSSIPAPVDIPPQSSTPAPLEELNENPNNGGAVHWKETTSRREEDSDGLVTQTALHNEAPLGSEENPIVRY